MFGQKKPPLKSDKLAERMRQVTSHEAPKFDPATLQRPAPSPKRAERRAVFRKAVLLLDDGERLEVAVKNLTTHGARVEFFMHHQLPERVTLIEPTLHIRTEAQVMWQDDGVAGLQFISGS